MNRSESTNIWKVAAIRELPLLCKQPLKYILKFEG